ncbi:MAG: 2-oxoacid:acceptor oxidoreductase subunit alpha [Bacillota bacterium]
MDYNILIGGEAGQGLKTTAYLLGKTIFRIGYHIFTTKDYMSRVRGGHNFIKIRFSDSEVKGPKDKLDLIIALNEETIENHLDNLKDEGILLAEREVEDLNNSVVVNAKEIAKDINTKGVNSVFIGAFLKTIGFDLEEAENVISEYFVEDNNKVKDNLLLLEKGYKSCERIEKIEMTKIDGGEERLYLDGNQAIGLGAATAGVSFYTAYPMSPSTGILNYLAKHQKRLSMAVEQAEDEIGAINMALGAAYGGGRAMVGTSGGGFALMNEGLGMAGVGEIPLVIAEVQRPGPATGLPTRTSQGDLNFVINSSQGEFPKMVIAPKDQEDAFYQTFRAHNLADKYQIPVIVLSDQFLADSSSDIKKMNLDELEVKRNLYYQNKKDDENEYKRYKLIENGISPRAYPGSLENDTILVDSHEHNEYGRVTEDIDLRNKMINKRENKINKLKREDLKQAEYFGEEDIDYLAIGWGSTYGPILEATKKLQNEDVKIGFLSFNDIWPLPTSQLEKWAEKDVEKIVIENNSEGQFTKLIGSELQIKIENKILKYSGRPFSGDEIHERLSNEVINDV